VHFTHRGDGFMSGGDAILSLCKTYFPFNNASTLCLFGPAVSTQRGTRPVSAPVFSQAALAEAGIPMAPFDQLQTSTPIKSSRKEERKLEVTVEAVEPSKIEAEVKVLNFTLITVSHVCDAIQFKSLCSII